MATITKGYIFGSTELVTNTKLHILVDDATISGITSTDMDFSNSAVTNYLVGWDGSKFNFMAQQSLMSIVIPAIPTDYVKNDGTVNPTNLISNGDFESWSAGTSAAPDGWALELTPTVARDTGDVGYGSYSAKITGNGAAVEGIKFTTGTLKPSTKYTLSIRVKATAGDTASIITTGATTNLDLESTSTTFETKRGTLTTDASGTAVVIKLLAKADTDIVWFDGVHLCEGESAFAFSPKPAEEGVWADYSASSTVVGWSSFTMKSIYTKKIGKTIFVQYALVGTSNSTSVTFTVPYNVVTTFSAAFALIQDNGGTLAAGRTQSPASGNIITVTSTMAGGGWTASGEKQVQGQFVYESA